MQGCKYRGKLCQPLNLFCQVVPGVVSSRTSFHPPSTQPMHRGPRSSPPLCHRTFLSLSVISSPPKGVIVPGEDEAVPPKETTDQPWLRVRDGCSSREGGGGGKGESGRLSDSLEIAHFGVKLSVHVRYKCSFTALRTYNDRSRYPPTVAVRCQPPHTFRGIVATIIW